MEMGNVSKRQQPDHRKKQQQKVTNRSSMSEKFPHPEASFTDRLTKKYEIYWKARTFDVIIECWLIKGLGSNEPHGYCRKMVKQFGGKYKSGIY